MAKIEDSEKIVKEAKKLYAECESAWSEQYNQSLEDLKFARLGEQWDEADRKAREKEGRPCLTINRLPSFIRQIVNDARINNPSIKTHPVDSKADPETAEVLDGLIKNIEYTSQAESAYIHGLDMAVTTGIGFWRVNLDYAYDDVFDLDLAIERIANPLSVYFDPSSTKDDGSDWRYCFVTENLAHNEFKERFPGKEITDWEGDYDDWTQKDMVRVAEYWKRSEEDATILMLTDGTILDEAQYIENKPLFDSSNLTVIKERQIKRSKICQYILNGTEVLEKTEWAGKYIPIVPCFGDEVIEQDRRHFLSLVRGAKDSQKIYNYWRTASTELVALAPKAPFIGPTGAFDTDQEKWGTANTETHAFIEYDGNIPPQRQPFAGPPAGAISEALSASDDMKSIMGIYDASLGKRSNTAESGKAIRAQQAESDVSTYHFIDNLTKAIKYTGRILLDLIPKVYDTPRIIRVMGYDETVKSVTINEPYEENGVQKLFDLTTGKYDITISTGPSFSTQREEALTQMTELIRAFPQAAPFVGDILAKNMDWPGADEMAKRFKVMLPPEIQALEQDESLPPEAQVRIAQFQQQMEQLQGVISQGQQLLLEKDEQIKLLELDNKNKRDELEVKNLDSQRKYQASMADTAAKERIAAQKEEEANRRLIIQESLDLLQNGITEVTQQVQPVQQQVENLHSSNQIMLEAIQNMMGELTEMKQPKSKTISITAPSGLTYEGTMENNELSIITPSGDEYNGNIEEE